MIIARQALFGWTLREMSGSQGQRDLVECKYWPVEISLIKDQVINMGFPTLYFPSERFSPT